MMMAIIVAVVLLAIALTVLSYRSIKPIMPDLFDSAAWEQTP